MTRVDLLSDTTYPQQAVERLDPLLDGGKLPVDRSQIYGLRQIARQQPGKVKEFADHQRGRAQRKQGTASEGVKLQLQGQIDFWDLVADLCSESSSGWSVRKEGERHLPEELRTIPQSWQGMTHEERSHRNALKKQRDKCLEQWKNEHIPAFFERFCTHALYLLRPASEGKRNE